MEYEMYVFSGRIGRGLLVTGAAVALVVGANVAQVSVAEAAHPYRNLGTSVAFNQNGPGYWVSSVTNGRYEVVSYQGAPGPHGPTVMEGGADYAPQLVAKPAGTGEGFWAVTDTGSILNFGSPSTLPSDSI